jgi:hypothetical protein
MQEQKQGQFDQPTMRETVNWVYVIAKGMAAAVWPFFRCDFGVHALGGAGVAAALIIVLFAVGQRAPEMMTYFYAWLVLTLWHGARARKLERKGVIQHSRWAGRSWLTLKLPFVRKNSTARGLDVLLCMVVGVAILPLSSAMGAFIMLGGLAMVIVACFEEQVYRTRVRRMRDSVIEMESTRDLFRGVRDDS